MAQKTCILCKENKSLANFIGTRSPLLGGAFPICRTCVGQFLKNKTEDERWNAANKLCQLADIPFIPEEFEKIYQAKGYNEAFGIYCSIFRDQQYNTLDWTMYNDAFNQLKKEERVEDALPEIKAARREKLIKKWGPNYDDIQIEYLENLHEGIMSAVGVVSPLQVDQILKLCKVSLTIEEKIRAGVDIDKDLKSYDSLTKAAGITTEQMKEGNEFSSAGEVFAFLEKLGYKPKYYDGAVRDEVDKSMKDIQYWLRYLYINETGIAEDIKERMEALKASDKLANEGFDWGEYQQYADEYTLDQDFEIDI